MPAIALARVRYAPGLRQPKHADDRIQVSLVLRGGLTERVGRHEERPGPLSLVVKARGVEHADDYGPRGVLIGNLALDGDAGEKMIDDLARVPDWRWSFSSPALRPMLRLVSRVRGARIALDADDPDVLDVLAAVTASSVETPAGTPPAWIVRVRQRFDDGEQARVRTIADDEGVHPVYLARVFRRWFGCSITGYLHRVRVARSALLMVDGTATLTDVAHAAGFSDQAHFCRRFKQATGLTPGRFRGIAMASGPALDVPAPRH